MHVTVSQNINELTDRLAGS